MYTVNEVSYDVLKNSTLYSGDIQFVDKNYETISLLSAK